MGGPKCPHFFALDYKFFQRGAIVYRFFLSSPAKSTAEKDIISDEKTLGVVILSMNEDPEVLRFQLRLMKQRINLRNQFLSYVCLVKQLDNDREQK